MTTHNDPVRHWAGDHGEVLLKTVSTSLQTAYDHAAQAKGGYSDAHAWQFTPDSFSEIISSLNKLGLIDLNVERVYQTPLNRFEFAAVLRKQTVS